MVQHEQVNRKNCVLCPDEFNLELLSNIDMFLMFKLEVCITQTVKDYARASNTILMKRAH